jgi:protein-tyrosine phosphatase
MIDLHIHILHGMDDGPNTLAESVAMCRISYQDGVRTIVATPHTGNGLFFNNRAMILEKVRGLSEALKHCEFGNPNCGIKNPEQVLKSVLGNPQPSAGSSGSVQSEISNPKSEITFRVLPGADVHFSPEIARLIQEGEIETVNDNGLFLMVEFPSHAIPIRAEEVLFQLIAKRIIPIITHPERNFEIGQNPRRYYEMIKMGCLGQVTAMSVTGQFGPEIKRLAEKLLRRNLIHFIASDAHSPGGRPPTLSLAVKAASKIVGAEEARKMVTEYPQAVLEGKRPHVPEPKPV